MTTGEIEQALMAQITLRSGLIVPHYTPPNWWECDVFELTRSGYGVEYEVKVSHADFLADSKKQRTRTRRKASASGAYLTETVTSNKHALLESHAEVGPSRFYYVAPAGLISRAELPAWAGLIEATAKTGMTDWEGRKLPDRIILDEAVKAPQLHRVKLNDRRLTHMFKTGYYRYRDLLIKGLRKKS